MTELDLEAIKKRADAASPPPWWADTVGAIHASGPITTDQEVIANIEFMCHAREDVPALITEIEQLRDWLDLQRRSMEFEKHDHAEALAEVERLSGPSWVLSRI